MAITRNSKILVVDDQRFMRRVHINVLNELGFRDIEEADDDTTAIERLKPIGIQDEIAEQPINRKF